MIVGGKRVIKILIPTVISFNMRSVMQTKNSKFFIVNGLGSGDGTIILKYMLFFSNMNPIIAITNMM